MTGKREQAEVTGPLLRALRDIPGIQVRRQHSGQVKVRGGYVHLGEEGWPDILVVHGSRCMFIETKTDSGKLSAAQSAMFERLQRQGVHVCIAVLVREGVEHVREWMREVGK